MNGIDSGMAREEYQRLAFAAQFFRPTIVPALIPGDVYFGSDAESLPLTEVERRASDAARDVREKIARFEDGLRKNRSWRYEKCLLSDLGVESWPPRLAAEFLRTPHLHSLLAKAGPFDYIRIGRPIPSIEEARQYFDDHWRIEKDRQWKAFQKRVAKAYA